MNHRMTFFEDRDSPLHRLNPLTKLLIVMTNIAVAFISPWYWTATLMFVLVVIPLSLWGRITQSFFKALLRLLLPAVVFLFVMQSFFYPGGQEVIFRIWFLSVTVEAVQAGYLISTRILVMVSSFILILLSTHPSMLMSDLVQRGLPGVLAYVITSTLQIIPQMRIKADLIIDAQRSRGLETQGKIRARIRALVPLVRPLIFGALVDVEERTIAIEARAFTSVLKKTSLVEIPDSSLERVLRWAMVGLWLVVIGWRVWLSLK
jgi:energy-coupling factor transport system permease protein